MPLSPVALALQEVTACWDQGYEALVRGDLERVAALMDIAEDNLGKVGNSTGDSASEAELRNDALSARGRLEYSMRAGMEGIGQELACARRGSKALRGYAGASDRLGGNVEKSS